MNLFEDVLQQEEIIELTQRLVRIPSDWDQPTREKNVLDSICTYLEEQKIPYEKQRVTEHTYNIIASYNKGKKGKRILLNGHVDTVPAYKMEFDPYEGFVRNGWIHGRGTVDMKGSVACMIMTLVAFHRKKIPLDGELVVTIVVGEEGSSEGTKKLVEEGITADVAIVGEPSNFDYAIAHRGLEWIQIDIHGKTAHSGIAHMGINAISKAATFIKSLEEALLPKLTERHHEYCGSSLLNFGKIEGGTQPSTVAGTCSIQLDRRYIPGETPESVHKEIHDVIKDLEEKDPDFKADILMMDHVEEDKYHHVPLNTDPNHVFLPILTDTIQEVVGKIPECSTKRGWTDAGLLSYYANIPTFVCGPGNITFSHSTNEKIAIDQLIEAVNLYFKVTCKYCNLGEFSNDH